MSLDLPSLQPLSHHPALTADAFDADAFLLSRAHIPLEELRGEFREYLAELREELTQLINDDYEEFISLGVGLRGEEERLLELCGPLKEASEGVSGVRGDLEEMQCELQSKLDARAACRDDKSLLHHMQRLLDTIARAEKLLQEQDNHPSGSNGVTNEEAWKRVSRLANEYNQIQYLLQKVRAEGCELATVAEKRVNSIRSSVSSQLSTLFVASIRDMDRERIKQSLQLYDLMDDREEAERVVGEGVDAMCQQSLILPTPPIAPIPNAAVPGSTPLSAAFNALVEQLQSYRTLIDAGYEHGWDFLSQVIWPRVASAIKSKLGSTIFSAGRPDDLHENYTTTHHFIAALEDLAPCAETVEAIRNAPASEELRRQWQLPVYFQLRWKEIVGKLERSLSEGVASGSAKTAESKEWALPQSALFWEGIQSCWSDKVFIPELGQRFLRLTIQILSRYETWLAIPDTGESDEALHRTTAALVDVGHVNKLIADLVSSDVYLSTGRYTSKTLSILTSRSLEPLKMVRSVASQLRATPASTNSPSRPSDFVQSITQPLRSTISSRPALASYSPEWAQSIASEVFTSYASTLISVRKTEDLLRRHRKIKKSGFSLFGSGSGAQQAQSGEAEDRALEVQMRLDMEALRADFEKMGVECEGMGEWEKLKEALVVSLEE